MLAPLIQEAQALPRVSQEAAREYREKTDILVDWVNRTMGEQAQIERLIGYNPLSVMHDNHYNHARFMANVFRFNAFELLAKTVVWVYRTYRAHGFDYDYFPLELSAWQQAVTAHLDASQTRAILAIYQWLLDRHQDMVKLSQQPPQEAAVFDPAWQATRRVFLQALLEGDSKKCLALGQKIARDRAGLETFYLEVIQPCMYDVGRLWEQGEISVAQEHLASAIIARQMAILQPALEMLQEPKGRAVVTAAPNEYHETGARCVADLLALDGWEIDYLGANTPQDELLKYLLQTKPNLLALSVAMPFNLDITNEAVAAVKEQPELAGIRVMVGGLAFAMVPELWQLTGADGYAPHAKAAVELARTWWG